MREIKIYRKPCYISSDIDTLNDGHTLSVYIGSIKSGKCQILSRRILSNVMLMVGNHGDFFPKWYTEGR